MPAPRILFRTDGNARIGLGHLTRCLALADMLTPAFDCTFALREPAEEIQRQVQAAGFALLLVPSTLALAEEPEWLQHQASTFIVLDGYDFSLSYQQQLRQRGIPFVYLDDFARDYQWADVVLNPTGGISASEYRHEPGTIFCLGPAYALLRPAFRQVSIPPTLDPNRIFLNMGGADPENYTLAVLRKLQEWLPQHTIEAVTGSAYPHQQTLVAAVQTRSKVQVHHNLSAEQMATVLARCGIKVCPPSGVAYECCTIGGLVFLHPTADNQQRLFHYLTEQQLAQPLSGLPALATASLPALVRRQAQYQRSVFDGQAGPRLQRVFQELALTYALTIRRAAPTDVELYYTWANDPDVRRNAIHQEAIPWESHRVWFARRLHDRDVVLFVFEQQGQPIGQVRIEFTGDEGLIDYSVAVEARGQGLGMAVLRRALRELPRHRPAPWTLVAHVKAGNLPSRRVFERLSFAAQPAVQLQGSTYDVFRLPYAPPA